jgi:hypothetical protein
LSAILFDVRCAVNGDRLLQEPFPHTRAAERALLRTCSSSVWNTSSSIATERRTLLPPRWRIDATGNEADLAGRLASSEFPSPLRRRYVAGSAFGLPIDD